MANFFTNELNMRKFKRFKEKVGYTFINVLL